MHAQVCLKLLHVSRLVAMIRKTTGKRMRQNVKMLSVSACNVHIWCWRVYNMAYNCGVFVFGGGGGGGGVQKKWSDFSVTASPLSFEDCKEKPMLN